MLHTIDSFCASGRDKKLEGEAAYRLGLAYAAIGNTETALVVSQLNFIFMCVYVYVHICLQGCMCLHNMCECISAPVLHLNACTGTSVCVCVFWPIAALHTDFSWQHLSNFYDSCKNADDKEGMGRACDAIAKAYARYEWAKHVTLTNVSVTWGWGGRDSHACLVCSSHSTFIHMTLLHSFGHQTLIFCPILWLLSFELLSALFYIMSIWNSFSASLLCH